MENIYMQRFRHIRNENVMRKIKFGTAIVAIALVLTTIGYFVLGILAIGITLIISVAAIVYRIVKREKDDGSFVFSYPTEPDGVICEILESEIPFSEESKEKVTASINTNVSSILDHIENPNQVKQGQMMEILTLSSKDKGTTYQLETLLVRPRKAGDSNGDIPFSAVLELFGGGINDT